MQQSQVVRVSVIVPCRNEIRHIRPFLDSVFRQDLGQIDMEVLIADGMSDDGTRLVLAESEKRFAGLRILDNPEQIVSTGLNRAIREATGEIILCMIVHTVYAPDYVRSCVEALRKTNAGSVGGPALTRADGYMAQAIAHAFHTRFASGGAKYRDPQYEGPVDTVPYGCWRKSTLELIGMFDETLVRGEDFELNVRIASSGGTVWQSPRIISWYQPRASLLGLFGQYFQYGFWKFAVTRKHRRVVSWRNLVPGSCLLLGIMLLLCATGADLAGLLALRSAFLISWAALACLYLAASLCSSFLAAKECGWKFLPIFPVVFAIHHLSYGLGFLLGLSYRPKALARHGYIQKAVTGMTR